MLLTVFVFFLLYLGMLQTVVVLFLLCLRDPADILCCLFYVLRMLLTFVVFLYVKGMLLTVCCLLLC